MGSKLKIKTCHPKIVLDESSKAATNFQRYLRQDSLNSPAIIDLSPKSKKKTTSVRLSNNRIRENKYF
jgi:hypothetical protein